MNGEGCGEDFVVGGLTGEVDEGCENCLFDFGEGVFEVVGGLAVGLDEEESRAELGGVVEGCDVVEPGCVWVDVDGVVVVTPVTAAAGGTEPAETGAACVGTLEIVSVEEILC